jgi:uncharacterized membrane protein
MSKPKTSERGRQSRRPAPPPVTYRRGRGGRREAARLKRRDDVERVPRRSWFGPWRAIVTSLIALAGTGVATYLTLAHYTTGIQLACPDTGVINCEAVTTSKQSVIFGVPVAVLGLCYFVPMLAICLPWAWRSANRLIAPIRLAMSSVGICMVFYLVYAELFEIQKICLWCTSVHVLTFFMFIFVVTGWPDATANWVDEDEDELALA